MGYEKIERRYPCPCGKGFQVAEWEEHDTWVSGNEAATYRLECPDCAVRYVGFYSRGFDHWVLKEDWQKLDELAKHLRQEQERYWQLVVGRYEQMWIGHVRLLPNRTAMKRELGAGTGFIKRATDPEYVEQVAREVLKSHPERCLEKLNVRDGEAASLSENIAALKKEYSEFESRINKIRTPDKRRGFE